MLAFLLGFGLVGASPAAVAGEQRADFVGPDDVELAEAEAEARAKLDVFLTAIADPPEQAGDFAVRVAFDDGVFVEHLWVGHLSWDGHSFVGIIDEVPLLVDHLALGDAVSVTPDEVDDWRYLEGRAVVGAFTDKILLRRE